MSVFISYSTQDKEYFDNICEKLTSRCVPFWNPELLEPGLSLQEQLRRAIESCKVCIFVATSRSLNSAWCQAELGAFWGAGKRVIVYLAKKRLEDKLPIQFRDFHFAKSLKKAVDVASEALAEAQDAAQNTTLVQLLRRDQRSILSTFESKNRRKLFVSGPTLSQIAYRQDDILKFLESGGVVQPLLPNPALESPALQGLKSHWHHGILNFELYLNELRSSLENLKVLVEKAKHASRGEFVVKYSDCAPTLSLMMTEHSDNSGSIQIELLPFNTVASARPHFVLQSNLHPIWHSFFKERCESMWNGSDTLDFSRFDIHKLKHLG